MLLPALYRDGYTYSKSVAIADTTRSPSSQPGLGPQPCVAHWTGVDHILASVDEERDQTDATVCV